MSKRMKLLIAGVVVVAVPFTVLGQVFPPNKPATGPAPTSKDFQTLYFNSNVGSFKILGAATHKAEGHVDITCKGTVLISGLEGTVTAANMRKEIDDATLQKRVYFGTGRMVIDGKFSGIQFFGRDMKSVWTGWGVVRLFGEFDKNLNTGEYWYAGDTEHKPWFNGGMTVPLPKPMAAGSTSVTPTIRDKG